MVMKPQAILDEEHSWRACRLSVKLLLARHREVVTVCVFRSRTPVSRRDACWE